MPAEVPPSAASPSKDDAAAADEGGDVLAPLAPSASGSRLSLNLDKMAQGEFQPAIEGENFLTTARAANEVAITVRGDSKVRAKRILQLLPKMLGGNKVKASWRPNSSQLAVASEKDGHCLLYLFTRASMPKPSEIHNLGPGQPTWMDWDCKGTSLAIMQEGVGIYLWDVAEESRGGPPSQPLRLAPSITSTTSFCMWSR